MEERIKTMMPLLNEKQRRIYLASEAMSYGYGGISTVSRISGVSIPTIRQGIKEIQTGEAIENGRIRKAGGGRKRVEDIYPEILEKIKEIVDGNTYGSPDKVLSWTTLSLHDIQKLLLEKYRIKVSYRTVGDLLGRLGYSKQTNQKMLQVGTPNPNRNEQFAYINNKVKQFTEAGDPVISVDTKKKENIGEFKNNGQEYRKKGEPRKVLDHDFPIPELGKVSPYGIYVINSNTGFVNLGTSHDTAEFAVESISRWWETIGKNTFPNSKRLMITCDCGGSNGCRLHLWKFQLAQFARRTGLSIHISHFPPGTSKWNKVEHRLFCYITKNWQGQPLVDIQTAVNLIGSTTTSAGLKVVCKADYNDYPLSKKVSDEEYRSIQIDKIDPFGDWNYIIR